MNGGAVAYLTHSQYGRNGNEITINNSSSYITGNAGNTVSSSSANGTTNPYNTKLGMLASTTGNIYGVYDLSGGAWEYTSVWNTKSSDPALRNNGKAVDGTVYFSTGGTSDRTKTSYSNEENVWEGNIVKTVCKIGDGIKETWISEAKSWFNDNCEFISSHGPFSIRGGGYYSKNQTGIFYSNGDTYGTTSSYGGFRLVLIY